MKSYGLCVMACIPVRRDPSDPSEMVTQLLFGEAYSIEDQQEKWLQIKCLHDNYTGWIDLKQHYPCSEAEALLTAAASCFALDNRALLTSGDVVFPILAGSPLPGLNPDGAFHWAGRSFQYEGEWLNLNLAGDQPLRRFADLVQRYLNAPYLWGGRSYYGIDCSGLMQVVYRLCGISLPRDAYQQAAVGDPVAFDDRKTGDLAFFHNPSGRVVHVGA
jgi:hypothetical protein